MDTITDVVKCECVDSKYIKPYTLQYRQDGTLKTWDIVTTHDSVAILLFHVKRKAFIFVKQFRAAVYINRVEIRDDQTVDTSQYGGQLGVTHELCAGIMDKDVSPEETALDEIVEECGYRLKVDQLQRVTSCRGGVGTSGAKQILFYAEVDDSMRVHDGGGVREEGEMIETMEIGVEDGRAFVMDETIQKPIGMMFALMWFYDQKYASLMQPQS